MAYIYVLQDQVTGRYYVGSCVDFEQRMIRHKKHMGGRTTKKGDWALLCYTECKSIEEARKMEKLVKSYKSGNAFRKIVLERKEGWEYL